MFLIRRLLTTAMLLGTFLGGYYLGRMPGSPDIIHWARSRYSKVSEASRFLAEFADTSQQEPQSEAMEETPDSVPGGRAYALWR